MTTTAIRPLLARPRDTAIGGVCSALAAHLGWRVGAVRVGMVAAAFAGGFGVLFYAWLWAFVPLQPARSEDAAAVRHRVPLAVPLAAGATVALANVVAYNNAADTLTVGASLITLVVFGGAAVAWSLVFDLRDPGRSAPYRAAIRYIVVVEFVVAGSLTLTSRPGAANAVISVGMIVLALGVLVIPRMIALWSALITERTARVREVQRAEIAAHLHDSVLQTLALIQNRAGASSEVARIARAQERELRDWLFAGDDPATSDLATQVRDIAAAIELDHAVRIDIVTAGEPVEAAGAIVAAAREAMLNAARHAGGEVSVYLESSHPALSGAVIDVFVRDRGPGVEIADIPDDRLGIRESIIGRMTRAGGTATVRPGAGGSGTEIHLHLEVAP